jgi:hypothetical protein
MVDRREQQEVFRSHSQLIAVVLVTLIFLGLLAGTAVKERNGPLIAIIMIPIILIGAVRLAMTRVMATDSGISVRNVFRSRFIPWDEIERFKVGRYQLLLAVCIIALRDGGTYHASAIQASNLTRTRPVNEATRLVDALNLRLTKARSDETASISPT